MGLSPRKENQRLGLIMTRKCVRVRSTLLPSFLFSFKEEEEINTGNEDVTSLMKLFVSISNLGCLPLG